MNKKWFIFALMVVAVLVLANSSYAAMGDETCPVRGAFSSIGGFLYNLLPWNWGNWMGQ